MSKFRSWVGVITCGFVAAGCHTPDRPFADGGTKAVLRPLGEGRFQVGSVQLDKARRLVAFEAVVNMVMPFPVEYSVVHKIGKTHEAIFRTDASAKDIQVAMLLLGARPPMTNAFPEDLALAPPGDKVDLEVSWRKNGEVVRHKMEDLVINRETGKPLTEGPWYYNGSNFSEGMFTAERDGSIVSIHIDPDALINNPRPGRDNDDLHLPNAEILPPVGARVEITIQLATP